MAFLPTVGTISYNGYTFTSVTRSHVAARPVYDQAGRTVVYVVYTVTVVFHIVLPGGGNVDATIADIRRRLQQAGAEFHYDAGTGIGDLTINAGNTKDVVWGPKPGHLNMRSLGSPNAYMVEWSVEIAIPECTNALYQFAILAFNYEVTYHIDADGYTSRTFAGYLEIPMTRATAGTRTLTDSADRYREQLSPDLPAGFQRTTQDWKVSADKRRIDFTVTDTEIPIDGLPAGATSATGSHTVSSTKPGMEAWNGMIQATYTIPKTYPKSMAWDVFVTLIQDRLNWLSQQMDPQGGKVFARLMGLKFREGLYQEGRQSSFEVAYYFPTTLFQILKNSGLWRPVPGADWATWAQSMGPLLGSSGVRGYQQLRNLPSDDAIVDLCGGQQAALVAGGFQPGPGGVQAALKAGYPPPEASWMHYACRLDVRLLTGIIKHKPLPATNTLTTTTLENLQNPATPQTAIMTAIPDLDALGFGPGANQLPGVPLGQLQNVQGNQMSSVQAPQPEILQQASTPTFDVRMVGEAVRCGYHIPCPLLLTVAGAPVYPREQVVRQQVIANYDVPVYYTSWDLEYLLKDLPSAGQEVPFPANPVLRVAG